MNKTLIGILILVGLLGSAAVGVYLMRPGPDRLAELLAANENEPEKAARLLASLNEDIKRSPEDFALRSTRCAFYAETGRNAEALSDVELLIKQAPDNLGLAFVRCTLLEKLGGPPREDHLACYRETAARFPDTPASPKKQNPDYIITALMAELPEAENLRRAYLAGLGDSQQDKHHREVLGHFKPEDLLQTRRP